MDCKKTIRFMYALFVACLIAGLFYNIGYSAKHPNQYIYIKGSEVNHNLFKVLDDCGIPTDQTQREAVFQRLKVKK